jgi:hypothetical protein
MNSPAFSFCAFHLARLWRAQPLVFLAATASVLVMAGSALAYYQQWRQVDDTVGRLQQLVAQTALRRTAVVTDKPAGPAVPKLPAFSSAELVATVNQVAADIGMPVEEISYRLEEGANTPYLRYRVTLSMAANYPLMRRFVDQMAMNLPHAVLDEISCSRDDIAVAALNCDLSFSAFFRKDGHG